MIQRFVLDCSLTMSWCFEEEWSRGTDEILNSFGQGNSALVPALWVWEVNNVLLTAQRSNRLVAAKRHQQLTLLKKLSIYIDEDSPKHAWDQTAALADIYRLSVYDASYLELALRHGIPLGSLDKNLRSAAKKAGAKCLPERLHVAP